MKIARALNIDLCSITDPLSANKETPGSIHLRGFMLMFEADPAHTTQKNERKRICDDYGEFFEANSKHVTLSEDETVTPVD